MPPKWLAKDQAPDEPGGDAERHGFTPGGARDQAPDEPAGDRDSQGRLIGARENDDFGPDAARRAGGSRGEVAPDEPGGPDAEGDGRLRL